MDNAKRLVEYKLYHFDRRVNDLRTFLKSYKNKPSDYRGLCRTPERYKTASREIIVDSIKDIKQDTEELKTAFIKYCSKLSEQSEQSKLSELSDYMEVSDTIQRAINNARRILSTIELRS